MTIGAGLLAYIRNIQHAGHPTRSAAFGEFGLALLAALDEANTERERLAKDNERCSEAWRRVVLRQQRTDNAHDYDMRQVEAERDRAVAQVERVRAVIAAAEGFDREVYNSEILDVLDEPSTP